MLAVDTQEYLTYFENNKIEMQFWVLLQKMVVK